MKVQAIFLTGLLGLTVGTFLGRIPAARAQGQLPRVTQNDVRSHQFTLIDQNGRTRACLGFRNGKPVLSFFDEKGNLIVSLNPENLRVHPSPIGIE
ncbi:MAG TPA: hypothetical protein VFB14_01935 [Bryobacteraceae bacterium]|jgi:hypothetical protein|nr:hypothetical protein [Bryobacteraceae bacterium]